MADKSSPDSITLTYDLIKWTIPARQKFPGTRGSSWVIGSRKQTGYFSKRGNAWTKLEIVSLKAQQT